MSMWNPTLVATSLNLRIERGHEASDYRLSGDVARSQLQFDPDFICNYEIGRASCRERVCDLV